VRIVILSGAKIQEELGNCRALRSIEVKKSAPELAKWDCAEAKLRNDSEVITTALESPI
jgi:hypothetical protein